VKKTSLPWFLVTGMGIRNELLEHFHSLDGRTWNLTIKLKNLDTCNSYWRIDFLSIWLDNWDIDLWEWSGSYWVVDCNLGPLGWWRPRCLVVHLSCTWCIPTTWGSSVAIWGSHWGVVWSSHLGFTWCTGNLRPLPWPLATHHRSWLISHTRTLWKPEPNQTQ
jgi:hypothetical protein